MIRAAAKDTVTGRTIIVFGLSHGNLVNLMMDKPIKVGLDEMGAPGCDLMIFVGRTEEEMAKAMAPAIGPDTRVHHTDPEEGDGHVG